VLIHSVILPAFAPDRLGQSAELMKEMRTRALALLDKANLGPETKQKIEEYRNFIIDDDDSEFASQEKIAQSNKKERLFWECVRLSAVDYNVSFEVARTWLSMYLS